MSPKGVDAENHLHSPSRLLDCYTLLFPLYIAGRSRWAPADQKQWILQQMHHISSHFSIRNASLVAQLLVEQAKMNPWRVYAMLGSYGFAA